MGVDTYEEHHHVRVRVYVQESSYFWGTTRLTRLSLALEGTSLRTPTPSQAPSETSTPRRPESGPQSVNNEFLDAFF